MLIGAVKVDVIYSLENTTYYSYLLLFVQTDPIVHELPSCDECASSQNRWNYLFNFPSYMCTGASIFMFPGFAAPLPKLRGGGRAV